MVQFGFGQTTSSNQGGFIRSGLRCAQVGERRGFIAGSGETAGLQAGLGGMGTMQWLRRWISGFK
ncbi:unnamed protein product [Malus baccata var. baccata]